MATILPHAHHSNHLTRLAPYRQTQATQTTTEAEHPIKKLQEAEVMEMGAGVGETREVGEGEAQAGVGWTATTPGPRSGSV